MAARQRKKARVKDGECGSAGARKDGCERCALRKSNDAGKGTVLGGAPGDCIERGVKSVVVGLGVVGGPPAAEVVVGIRSGFEREIGGGQNDGGVEVDGLVAEFCQGLAEAARLFGKDRGVLGLGQVRWASMMRERETNVPARTREDRGFFLVWEIS